MNPKEMTHSIRFMVCGCFLFAFMHLATGQSIELPKDRVTFPSPNIASLGAYGNYPVNLASGLVQIDIPVYTIKTTFLEVPISLSYHASGIKVDDIPGWVGLGWNLNAGGAIMIDVRGSVDQAGDTKPSAEQLNTEKYQYETRCFVVGMSFPSIIAKLEGYSNNQINSGYDTEYDVYSYNVPGNIAGSYTYNRQNELFQVPLTDNKITKSGNQYIITSDNGTRYIFDKKNEETTLPTSGGSFTSAIYLSQMISANNSDTITFTYTQGRTYTILYPNFQIIQEYRPNNTMPNYSTAQSYNGATVSEKLLQEISFRNGKVVFETASGDNKLTGIKVFSTGNNTPVTTTTFQYSNFVSLNSTHTRLKLEGLTIGNQKYSFKYNATQLPTYFSGSLQNAYFSQDAWGYYNGKNNSNLLANNARWSYLYSYADRSVDEEKSKACILEQITYPTKGYIKFYYQSNMHGTVKKGGLRIRLVESYDANGNKLREWEYEYKSGRPMSVYDFYTYYMYGNRDRNHRVTYQTSSPVLPLGTNAGCPMFYDHVVEYFGTAKNNSGKKEYKYDFYGDEFLSGGGSNKNSVYRTNNSWMRGSLLEETYYKNNGDNTYTLMRKTVNNYKFLKESRQNTGIRISKSTFSQPSEGRVLAANCFDDYNYQNSYINTGVKKMIASTTTEYEGGVAKLVDYTQFKYERAEASSPHFNLTETKRVTSACDTIVNRTIYSRDYTYSGLSSDRTINEALARVNVILPVEQVTYVKKGAAEQVIAGNFYRYGTTGNLLEAHRIQTDVPFPYTPSRVINSSGYAISDKYKPELAYQYNSRSNLLMTVKNNIDRVIYLWSYNYRYPIAEIKGATYADVKTALGYTQDSQVETLAAQTNPDVNGATIGGKLRSYFANKPVQITTYTYRPLVGIESVTGEDGLRTTYEYDSQGRLVYVKDNNGKVLNKYEYNYKQ